MDCESLKSRIDRFPDDYLNDFDDMWKWKIQIESKNKSILDEDNIREAYNKLSTILQAWQTYRNGKNGSPIKTLGKSLQNISEDYNKIREYSLLDFESIPERPLKKIWHQLGRVKEYEGQTNEKGNYYAIAATKPLLLLWGQTLAFDCRVRRNLPRKYGISRSKYKLDFEKWRRTMCLISRDLNDSLTCVKVIKEMSLNRYKFTDFVPYGRFLDIYYWAGK
jgi:hypothetical protein